MIKMTPFLIAILFLAIFSVVVGGNHFYVNGDEMIDETRDGDSSGDSGSENSKDDGNSNGDDDSDGNGDKDTGDDKNDDGVGNEGDTDGLSPSDIACLNLTPRSEMKMRKMLSTTVPLLRFILAELLQ